MWKALINKGRIWAFFFHSTISKQTIEACQDLNFIKGQEPIQKSIYVNIRKILQTFFPFYPVEGILTYWPFGLGSYSMREIASYSNEGLLAAVILWTRSEPWWGNSLGLVESVEKISHPAPCYLNSGELIAIILSDWYCSPKRDLNLGLSRIAVFEDCNATALSNHRWMRTCLMTW